MKKKTIQKLRLVKISIASLSTTKQATVKGRIATKPESVCICSWPSENC